MAFQILVADEHEGFGSQLVKKLALFPQFKVTHVKDALEAFRKTRVHRYDGIFLTDTLPKIGLQQLIAAIRELDNNKSAPVFLFSAVPENLAAEAKKFERVMLYHRETGIDEAMTWIKDWLLSGKKQQEEELHPPVKVDVRIVNQMIQATMYSLELFGGINKVQPMPIEAFYKNTRYIDKLAVAGATAIMSTVFAGTILIAFPEETFLKVVNGALGESYAALTPDLMDACGELINIIYGQAKTILVDEMDIDFMKSRPYIIEDKERIRGYHSSSSFIVPFESDAGRLFLIVSFESIKSNVETKAA
jgi:chemotaxis protein CheX